MPIKNKVKRFAAQKGLSIYRINQETGVSKTLLHRLANDPNELTSLSIMGRICDTYKVPVTALVEWTE